MDLFEYIQACRRTRSIEQVKNDLVFELIEPSIYKPDLQFVNDAILDSLAAQNTATNGAFGLVAEVFEFMEIANDQPRFMITDEEKMADELGDVWYYAATLIDVLPMQMSLEEKVNMFFNYYLDGIYNEDILDCIQNIASMGKKICCHAINPNADYKNSGITFNQIFMRNLADLMFKLIEEINVYLKFDKQYSLADIWQYNCNKLQKRHPTGFDNSYNYEHGEEQDLVQQWEREIFP